MRYGETVFSEKVILTFTSKKRSFSDPVVQNIIDNKLLGYEIKKSEQGSDESLVVAISSHNEEEEFSEFTPEEISSAILAKLKADGEKESGRKITGAVITVPAFFNDKQRHATLLAGKMAGLSDCHLLPEPSAAAVAFGIDEEEGKSLKTIIVFDFGGGTLDISALTLGGERIVEQGKVGDMWLGGKDLDQSLAQYLLKKVEREDSSICFSDILEKMPREKVLIAHLEMEEAAERAKIQLAKRESTKVVVSGIFEEEGLPVDFEVSLTRKELDTVVRPFVYSDECIQAALAIRFVYNLPLRATQGFLQGLAELTGLQGLDIPHYSSLSRRAAQLKIDITHKAKTCGPTDIVIDSTGLKIYGEGEWKMRIHGKSKRRTWRKLHIAMNPDNKQIVKVELTKATVHDDQATENLLNGLSGIDNVYADGAYISEKSFDAIVATGAKAKIPLRTGTSPIKVREKESKIPFLQKLTQQRPSLPSFRTKITLLLGRSGPQADRHQLLIKNCCMSKIFFVTIDGTGKSIVGLKNFKLNQGGFNENV